MAPFYCKPKNSKINFKLLADEFRILPPRFKIYWDWSKLEAASQIQQVYTARINLFVIYSFFKQNQGCNYFDSINITQMN